MGRVTPHPPHPARIVPLPALPHSPCVPVPQGVPWYKGNGSCNATLLYCVFKNKGQDAAAGNAAFPLLFVAAILHLFSVFALYTRWAGRSSYIPHGAYVSPCALGIAHVCEFWCTRLARPTPPRRPAPRILA